MGLVPHKAIARMLDSELQQRREWNEAPGLYTIRLLGPIVRLAEIPIPEAVWDANINGGMRVPEVLDVIANRIALMLPLMKVVAPDITSDIYGVAFRCEAYGTTKPPDDRDGRGIGDLPDSHELRMFTAIDRDGIRYLSTLVRGERIAESHVLLPDDEDDRVEGAIVEALDCIMADLLVSPGGGP